MDYRIREMEAHDLSDVESIMYRSFSPQNYDDGYMEQLRWLIENQECRYLLCAEGHEVAGFIHGDHTGEIEYIAVDEDYRREGIGKRLALSLLRRFKEDGLERAILTPTSNSEKIHARIGFHRCGDGRMAADIDELLEDSDERSV